MSDPIIELLSTTSNLKLPLRMRFKLWLARKNYERSVGKLPPEQRKVFQDAIRSVTEQVELQLLFGREVPADGYARAGIESPEDREWEQEMLDRADRYAEEHGDFEGPYA